VPARPSRAPAVPRRARTRADACSQLGRVSAAGADVLMRRARADVLMRRARDDVLMRRARLCADRARQLVEELRVRKAGPPRAAAPPRTKPRTCRSPGGPGRARGCAEHTRARAGEEDQGLHGVQDKTVHVPHRRGRRRPRAAPPALTHAHTHTHTHTHTRRLTHGAAPQVGVIGSGKKQTEWKQIDVHAVKRQQVAAPPTFNNLRIP